MVTIKFNPNGLSNGQLIHLASVLQAMAEELVESASQPGRVRSDFDARDTAEDLKDGVDEINAVLSERKREDKYRKGV